MTPVLLAQYSIAHLQKTKCELWAGGLSDTDAGVLKFVAVQTDRSVLA